MVRLERPLPAVVQNLVGRIPRDPVIATIATGTDRLIFRPDVDLDVHNPIQESDVRVVLADAPPRFCLELGGLVEYQIASLQFFARDWRPAPGKNRSLVPVGQPP